MFHRLIIKQKTTLKGCMIVYSHKACEGYKVKPSDIIGQHSKCSLIGKSRDMKDVI